MLRYQMALSSERFWRAAVDTADASRAMQVGHGVWAGECCPVQQLGTCGRQKAAVRTLLILFVGLCIVNLCQ